MLYTSLKWSSVSFLAPEEGAAAAAGAGAGAGAALGLGAAGAGLASSAGRGEGIGLTAGWLAPASFEAEHTPPTAKGGGVSSSIRITATARHGGHLLSLLRSGVVSQSLELDRPATGAQTLSRTGFYKARSTACGGPLLQPGRNNVTAFGFTKKNVLCVYGKTLGKTDLAPTVLHYRIALLT